jgi:hypothetical protein
MSNLASPEVERENANKHSSRHTCQDTEDVNVSSLVNPLIYVKAEQESEKSYTDVLATNLVSGKVLLLERQTFVDRLSNDDLARNWTI